MSRRPDWVPKRKYLTAKERAAMVLAQGNKCKICGGPPPFEADHTEAVSQGNMEKPDRLICLDCHLPKSKAEAAIALAGDKMGGRVGQYARRKRNGSRLKSRKQFPKGRKIQSGQKIKGRGFAKKASRP